MMFKPTDKKLVVILDSCVLPELGYIYGPITHPSMIRIDIIQKLVLNRRNVYECNPNDKSDRVKLTSRNVRKVIFQEPEDGKKSIKTIKPELILGKDVDLNKEERIKNLIGEPKIESTSQDVEEVNNTIENNTVIESNTESINSDLNEENNNNDSEIEETESTEDDINETIIETDIEQTDDVSEEIDDKSTENENHSTKRRNRKNRK